MIAHFQGLKGEMNRLREIQRTQLTKLTLETNAAVKELQRKCRKVGHTNRHIDRNNTLTPAHLHRHTYINTLNINTHQHVCIKTNSSTCLHQCIYISTHQHIYINTLSSTCCHQHTFINIVTSTHLHHHTSIHLYQYTYINTHTHLLVREWANSLSYVWSCHWVSLSVTCTSRTSLQAVVLL